MNLFDDPCARTHVCNHPVHGSLFLGNFLPKMIFYSAHDTTLVGVYDALGTIDDDTSEQLLPGYVNSVILELWCVVFLCSLSGSRVRNSFLSFAELQSSSKRFWENSLKFRIQFGSIRHRQHPRQQLTIRDLLSLAIGF